MYLRSRSSGFTLIELMVVLALVAIVAFVALPGFNSLIDNNRQSTATNSMIGMLNYARSEAVRRGAVTEIAPQGTGFVVRTNVGGAPVVVREMGRLPGGASITRLDGGGVLEFRATGRSNAAGVTPARYRVCGASGLDGVVIRVNLGGQITTEPGVVACP